MLSAIWSTPCQQLTVVPTSEEPQDLLSHINKLGNTYLSNYTRWGMTSTSNISYTIFYPNKSWLSLWGGIVGVKRTQCHMIQVRIPYKLLCSEYTWHVNQKKYNLISKLVEQTNSKPELWKIRRNNSGLNLNYQLMNISNLLIFNKLLIFIYYINKIKDIHITYFKYYFYWPKKGYYFYYL